MNLKNHLKDNRRHNIVTASAAWGAIYERKKLWRQKTLREAPFKGNIMTEWRKWLYKPLKNTWVKYVKMETNY